jgi:hypothetical protein
VDAENVAAAVPVTGASSVAVPAAATASTAIPGLRAGLS